MSVINKVEEAYLGILRLIIIIVASVLLIGTVAMGVLALNGITSAGKAEIVDTTVKPDEVIVKTSGKKEGSERQQSPTGKEKPKAKLDSDPNQIFYDRAATAVIKFVEQYAQGHEQIVREEVIQLFRRNAENYDDPAVITAFASGLAETFEKALSAQPIISRVAKAPGSQPQATVSTTDDEPPQAIVEELPFKESPIQVANEIFGTYRTMFAEKQQAKQAAEMTAATEEAGRKADAMMKLYAAGAAFGAFLFLVFISIVVKIERNLRGLKNIQ